MTKFLSALFLVLCSAIGQSYYLSQLPPLNTVSETAALIPVWSGTNLYSATPEDITYQLSQAKVSVTNGSAINLSVTGGSIWANSSNNRLGIGNTSTLAPLDVWMNLVSFGANDGASTIRTRSNNTSKDVQFLSPTYAGSTAYFLRYNLTASDNNLYIGGGLNGNRGATRTRLLAYTNLTDTTGATAATITTASVRSEIPFIAGDTATISGLLSPQGGLTVPSTSTTTISGPLTMNSLSFNPLYVDSSGTYRFYARNHLAGAAPIGLIANIVAMGANDGNATNAALTASVSKDLSLHAYAYDNSYVGFIRQSASSGSHNLTVGYAQGGYKASTSISFGTAANVAATSSTTYGNLNASGQWTFGDASPATGAAVTINSTSRLFVPPRMTDAQAVAIATKPQGGVAFSTDKNKYVLWNGSQFYEMQMCAATNVVWDIPNTLAGATSTTTVTVTGAAAGNLANVTPSRIGIGLMINAAVTGADTVTLYYDNMTLVASDPGSQTYRVEVTK